jgi:hypothetical protein
MEGYMRPSHILIVEQPHQHPLCCWWKLREAVLFAVGVFVESGDDLSVMDDDDDDDGGGGGGDGDSPLSTQTRLGKRRAGATAPRDPRSQSIE